MTKIVNGDSYRKMLSREIKLQKIQNLRNIANQVKKKENKKDRKKGEFQGAETKVVWSIAKTSIQIHQTYPPNETRFDKTKGKVWNLIQWQEFWIHLTKFDATTRKLNRQYDIQLAVTKIPWYVAMKCDTHDGNSIFGVSSTSYPISLMLHVCIAYDINMTLLWWIGVAKSRYQFIGSSWDFLSMVTLIDYRLDYRCP